MSDDRYGRDERPPQQDREHPERSDREAGRRDLEMARERPGVERLAAVPPRGAPAGGQASAAAGVDPSGAVEQQPEQGRQSRPQEGGPGEGGSDDALSQLKGRAREAARRMREAAGEIGERGGPAAGSRVQTLLERATSSLGQATSSLGQRPEERVAAALGLFSLGLGAAELGAPRLVGAVAGVRSGLSRRLLLRALGARELGSGIALFSTSEPSLALWARVGGDAVDLALLRRALRSKRNGRGRVALALLAVCGVTALDAWAAVRLARRAVVEQRRLTSRAAVTVNRSPEDVYRFWHQLDRLPSFMEHLEEVETTGDRRSHWRLRGPAGRSLEWDAEIVEDRPGELLSWRSLPGSTVTTSGSVRFRAAPGGRGTEVIAEISYALPGGLYGETLARVAGHAPHQLASGELRRFKQVMETGDVVRSEGAATGASPARQLRQPPGQPAEAGEARRAS